MKAKSKIECCGSNFENDNISSIGLLTLSTPIIIISSLLYIVFLALSFIPIFKNFVATLKIVIKANIQLIEKKDFNPRIRCNLSSYLSPLSPSLSRFAYQHFNLMLLLFPWMLFVAGVCTLV